MKAEPTSIAVAFNPTKVDILRVGYVALRSRPVNFALSVAFFIATPWVGAVIGIILSARGGSLYSTAEIAGLIALPPVAVGLFGWLAISQAAGARTLDGTHTYDFSPEGIRLQGPGFDNRIAWSLITTCYGCKLGLVLKSGNAFLISIPGRVLSPGTQVELRRLMTEQGIATTGPW